MKNNILMIEKIKLIQKEFDELMELFNQDNNNVIELTEEDLEEKIPSIIYHNEGEQQSFSFMSSMSELIDKE